MSNIEQVFDALHDAVLEHLGGAAQTSDSSVIAFEPGMPIPDETFRLGDAAHTLSKDLAREFMSAHADTLPEVKDSLFVRRMATVEAHYALLLAGAMPADPAAVEMLGVAKRNGAADFDVEVQALQPGMGRYRPVTATPSNWYDLSADGNWTTISIGGADQPPPPPRSGNRPRYAERLTSWQTLPATEMQVLTKPRDIRLFDAEQEPPPQIAPDIRTMEILKPAVRVNPAAIDRRWMQQVEVTESAVMPTASVALTLPRSLNIQSFRLTPIRAGATGFVRSAENQIVKPKLFNYERLAVLPDLVLANATPKPVTASSLSISFRLCLVRIQRHWLSEALLSLSNWYLPTYPRGSLSDGVSFSAPMALIPTACILIRDLSIKGTWTDGDRAVLENSASLGPLSLLGRGYDAGSATISVSGMQSVGWLCERMRALPPQGDPNLPVA